MKLLGKILIKGSLTTLTGLHLGGSKSSLNIGGVDNNVIRDAKGRPYIPGSSLKGKLRSLLAKMEGSLYFDNKSKKQEVAFIKNLLHTLKDNGGLAKYKSTIEQATTDEECPHLIELFGYSGDTSDKKYVGYTRLLVRDALLSNPKEAIFKDSESLNAVPKYTGVKWENVIDRKTGTAEHPRQIERVPVGAKFNLELVYNIYEENNGKTDKVVEEHLKRLRLALKLLEDDGIGGSISRGYGQVKVGIASVDYKLINTETLKYESMQPVDPNQQLLLAEFTNEFPQLT